MQRFVGKRLEVKLRNRLENNIKIDFSKTCYFSVDWIEMALKIIKSLTIGAFFAISGTFWGRHLCRFQCNQVTKTKTYFSSPSLQISSLIISKS
jgi:hypothetical protein